MKRKNKPIRRPDAVQPLPLPADADEIAFAHGVSRRVVVVDAAESPLFEQIIYIVRDDAASGGVTAADLVQQARDAVGHVPAAPTPRPRQKSYTGLLIWLCSVAGVLAAGIGYCLSCGWSWYESPATRRDMHPPGRFLRKNRLSTLDESVKIKRLKRFLQREVTL